MKILVTGNMGYVGPLVLRRLRESYPGATLVGYDMGYFAHCLTGTPRFPETRADIQHFGDIRHVPEEVLRGVDLHQPAASQYQIYSSVPFGSFVLSETRSSGPSLANYSPEKHSMIHQLQFCTIQIAMHD